TGHEARRTAAILGWTSAAAPGAEGIGFSNLQRRSVFDADLVAPGDVQVVLIDKLRTLAEPQLSQRHVRRRHRHLPRAVMRGAQLEIVEVDTFPPHGDLDHAMKGERST